MWCHITDFFSKGERKKEGKKEEKIRLQPSVSDSGDFILREGDEVISHNEDEMMTRGPKSGMRNGWIVTRMPVVQHQTAVEADDEIGFPWNRSKLM